MTQSIVDNGTDGALNAILLSKSIAIQQLPLKLWMVAWETKFHDECVHTAIECKLVQFNSWQ